MSSVAPSPTGPPTLEDVSERLRRLEDAHVRLRQLQALTAALAVARTPEDIARALLGEGLALFGADAANVYGVGPGGDLVQLGVWGPQGAQASTQHVVRRDAALPHCEAVRTGRAQWLLLPAVIARDWPHLEGSRAALGHHAWVSLPLCARGQTLGVVGLAFASPVVLGPDVRGYLEMVVALAAQALERAAADAVERRAAAALRESEGRMRALVHATSQALWSTDPEGRVQEPDAAWCAFTGQTPEEFLGSGWLDAVHPDDRERAGAAWRRAHRSGERYEVEYRLRRPDGRYTWTRAYGAPVRHPHTGAITEWMGMNLDISEAKRAEEFEQQLVGIVSHDLRNPLSAVRFATEMARRAGPLTERQRTALARVDAATERSLRMVRDLLDFTQARLGEGLTVAPRASDAHALLQDVAAEVREAHPACRVEVHTQGPGAAWLDPDRVAQLLTNLLANAVAYGAPGAPVTAHCSAGPGGVVYEVHNTGEPIRPELLPVLFEPLRRGSAAGAEARSIGLGLYIVRQLVLAHGGRVGVTSTAADGTRFRVELPRDARAAA